MGTVAWSTTCCTLERSVHLRDRKISRDTVRRIKEAITISVRTRSKTESDSI